MTSMDRSSDPNPKMRTMSEVFQRPKADEDEVWRQMAQKALAQKRAKVHINSKFDSGSIEVVSCMDPGDIHLKLVPEPYCASDQRCHMQWFYFRVSGVRGAPLTIALDNAGEASFPEAWPGYCACASYDREFWFRVRTNYNEEEGVLKISHTPEQDTVYYAYFAPYTLEQHQSLVSRLQCCPTVRHEVLGLSPDGHDIDLLIFGGAPGGGPDVHKGLKVWLVARQHPGESMAEWFIEGCLERLVDPHDGLAMKILRQAAVYVIPNMCPDGTARGHQRSSSTGANLNRCWAEPTEEYCPEVYHCLRKMREVGCDLFLDIHGDEEIPYNFLAGEQGIPSYDDHLRQLEKEFNEAFMRASPDFQAEHGYQVDQPGQAVMSIASNAVGELFHCYSATIEMPFKDVADSPDELTGWCPKRCKAFGATILQPIYQVLPRLRRADQV